MSEPLIVSGLSLCGVALWCVVRKDAWVEDGAAWLAEKFGASPDDDRIALTAVAITACGCAAVGALLLLVGVRA
jgi:hypothetical protein